MSYANSRTRTIRNAVCANSECGWRGLGYPAQHWEGRLRIRQEAPREDAVRGHTFHSFLCRPLRRRHISIKKLLGHLRTQAESFFDGGESEKRGGDGDQGHRLEVLSEKHLDL